MAHGRPPESQTLLPASEGEPQRRQRLRRARSPLLMAEYAELSEEDRARRRIELVGITPTGTNQYRLDFVDWGAPVSFVLEDVPGRGVRISSEFSQHFHGRASAHEAFKAVGKVARGVAVDLPIEIEQDGGFGPCR